MREDRRLWIYAGLAIPEGLAATRRSVYRTEPRRGVLLLGALEEPIRPLVQTLTQLPLYRVGGMVVDLHEGADLEELIQTPWIETRLTELGSDMVLLAFSPVIPEWRGLIEEHVQKLGAQPVWLADPELQIEGCVPCPANGSALEIATWASRVWDMIS